MSSIDPITGPLPPQTRYYHPFSQWSISVTILACWTPAIWGITKSSKSMVTPYILASAILTILALFVVAITNPEEGKSHMRRLDTAFGPRMIRVFRPYFGRKRCEVTGGIIAAKEPGKVVDLDEPYGPCPEQTKQQAPASASHTIEHTTITMADLLSLPNEILVRIFSTCSTQPLLHLSGANRRLRAIWLEHSNHIIPAAYSHIQHFDDAVDYTLTERRLIDEHQATAPGSPSELRLSLPHILREADLALEVCERHVKYASNPDLAHFVRSRPDQTDQKPVTPASLLPAYYLLRRINLAYRHRELRPQLLSQLHGLPIENFRTKTDAMLKMWMLLPADLQGKLGMIERGDGSRGDNVFARSQDSWRFAHATLESVRAEKASG
ncbi:hypothetical protein Q7P37_002366 [Cladosporium fusiforme]